MGQIEENKKYHQHQTNIEINGKEQVIKRLFLVAPKLSVLVTVHLPEVKKSSALLIITTSVLKRVNLWRLKFSA